MQSSLLRCLTASAVVGFTVFAFFQLRPDAVSASPDRVAAAASCPYEFIAPERKPFRNPPSVSSRGKVLRTTLEVVYTNPAKTTLGGCHVKLRSYNGRLVGPTLRARPGDTLRIRLRNNLPRESAAQLAAQRRQELSSAIVDMVPHSFNTTNLHTHGLHVSPKGHSDNVLLAIKAQTTLEYVIKIPSDHPSGTFWYHAHAHGSTAIQVGSAMAGALIVEDRLASLPAALREPTRNEKIFVIQTPLYDTTGRLEDIRALFPGGAFPKGCLTPRICTWQVSKRRMTVNGQIVPTITMRPGEVQRWRFVDTSFRENVELRLQGHALHEIALDGIYLDHVDRWAPQQSVFLGPGYRSDVLVKASSRPGIYRLYDAPTPASRSLRQEREDVNVLAELHVTGEPHPMPLPTNAELARLLPRGAPFRDGKGRPRDLRKTADGEQTAIFTIGGPVSKKDQRNYFHVNHFAFTEARVRYLQLGATEQWKLTAVQAPHVFHIHVNPFQVARRDPFGNNELVWKDTLVLLPAANEGVASANIWTQYIRYTGKFVVHCHILDHEDLGMMEVEDVVPKVPPPDPTPGSGHGHG